MASAAKRFFAGKKQAALQRHQIAGQQQGLGPLVDGQSVVERLDQIDAILTRTANGGAEITKLVGTSAWYAPGASAALMVEAILKDQKKIMPCSVYLQGEYGVNNLFVGVPVKLGAKGVEQIIQIKLTADEQAAFNKSAGAVKELVDVIGV